MVSLGNGHNALSHPWSATNADTACHRKEPSSLAAIARPARRRPFASPESGVLWPRSTDAGAGAVTVATSSRSGGPAATLSSKWTSAAATDSASLSITSASRDAAGSRGIAEEIASALPASASTSISAAAAAAEAHTESGAEIATTPEAAATTAEGVGTVREHLEQLRQVVEGVGQSLREQRLASTTGAALCEAHLCTDAGKQREVIDSALRFSRSVRARLLTEGLRESDNVRAMLPMMLPPSSQLSSQPSSQIMPLSPSQPSSQHPAPAPDSSLRSGRAARSAAAGEIFGALPKNSSIRAQVLVQSLAEEGFQATPDRVVGRKWQGEDQEDDLECPICLARFLPGDLQKVTSCGHRFHYRCLRSWLVERLASACPVCRGCAGGAAALARGAGQLDAFSLSSTAMARGGAPLSDFSSLSGPSASRKGRQQKEEGRLMLQLQRGAN